MCHSGTIFKNLAASKDSAIRKDNSLCHKSLKLHLCALKPATGYKGKHKGQPWQHSSYSLSWNERPYLKIEMIKQAGVLQVENLISIGCTRKTTKPVVVSYLLRFLHWMYPPTCLLSSALAAIPKCIFAHSCKQKSAYSRKMCFWVCKQQHWLRKHALVYLCKSDGGSALSIMCEICYRKSCLILQTISALICVWLPNTLWQEQLVTFRTSKLCRKSGAIIGKTFCFS